ICSMLSTLCPQRSTLVPYTTLFRSRRGTTAAVNYEPIKDEVQAGANNRTFQKLCTGLLKQHYARTIFSRLHNVLFLYARNLMRIDRKSTRLNSSHVSISYAVFCLKQ